MCGIAGLALRRPDKALRATFARLAQQHLHRRGPDAQGLRHYAPGADVSVDLIHARLSIIDLSGGAQPMEDDDGALVYNGEIYNYRELREPGVAYATKSDTEILLKGLARQGLDFLPRADGMYAFGWLDKRRRKLVVARDEFGIKPAYILKTDTAFAFASTLTPLMALSRKEINGEALAEYYMFRAMRGAHTIFTDIVEIAPGAACILDLDTWSLEFTTWTKARAATRYADATERADALDRTLDDSVKRHLIADVPVAVLLSGGIDSSLVAAYASQHTDRLAAFTIGFRDQAFDETPYAAAVARRYGLNHHVLYCEDDNFIDAIAQWPLVIDDAVANPSSVLLHVVSQFARDTGYKVLLTGEGSDEFFGGYNQQFRFALAQRVNPVARHFGFMADLLQNAQPQRTRLVHAARMATRDCEFHGTSTIVEPWLAQQIFSDPPRLPAGARSLKDALAMDRRHRLPDDMLTAADRATMHASVEARVPFVDRAIDDFVAGMDDGDFIAGRSQKALLRTVARRRIPAECIDRAKVGFDLPLARWFRTSMRDRLMQSLADTWQRDYFRPGALEKIVDWHMSGRANMADKLWAFWFLEHNIRALRAVA